MNNNEQQINEALQWLQSTGQSLVDFTSEQAPLYCQEVLNWTFYSNLILSVCFILWIIGSLFLIKPLIKAWNFDFGSKGGFIFVPSMVALVLSFVFVFLTIESVVSMVKVKVAPRMVLVEHFQ